MGFVDKMAPAPLFRTSCGASPPIAGPEWICRICVARPWRLPDHAHRPRSRDRYRAARLCRCGGERDWPDRQCCKSCRRRQADATASHRTAHPPDRKRLYADVRERRRRRIAAGLCADCGGERDRLDRNLCARCRRLAGDRAPAHSTPWQPD